MRPFQVEKRVDRSQGERKASENVVGEVISEEISEEIALERV